MTEDQKKDHWELDMQWDLGLDEKWEVGLDEDWDMLDEVWEK